MSSLLRRAAAGPNFNILPLKRVMRRAIGGVQHNLRPLYQDLTNPSIKRPHSLPACVHAVPFLSSVNDGIYLEFIGKIGDISVWGRGDDQRLS